MFRFRWFSVLDFVGCLFGLLVLGLRLTGLFVGMIGCCVYYVMVFGWVVVLFSFVGLVAGCLT